MARRRGNNEGSITKRSKPGHRLAMGLMWFKRSVQEWKDEEEVDSR